jgi:hypothetical protein
MLFFSNGDGDENNLGLTTSPAGRSLDKFMQAAKERPDYDTRPPARLDRERSSLSSAFANPKQQQPSRRKQIKEDVSCVLQ